MQLKLEEDHDLYEMLSAFGLTVNLRNKIRNIILHLRKHGKTVDDYLSYVEDVNQIEREQIARLEKSQKESEFISECPDCQSPMFLRTVNDRGNRGHPLNYKFLLLTATDVII